MKDDHCLSGPSALQSQLTNLSPLNDVVFRVRTRNPDAFTCPSDHHGHCTDLRAPERYGSAGLDDPPVIELFVVQSVEREEEVQAMEPLDPNSNTSLRAFWKKNKMVCRFTGASGFPAAEVTQDWNMFSRSMSSASSSSQEYRSSRSENRSLSMSARENRLSRSGSSSGSSLSRSFSNQFTPPEEMRRERRSRQESFGSDASFYTTIEHPMLMDRRMSASKNYATPTESQAINRRSEAKTAGSTNATLSRPPMTRQRDTVLTSISVSDSSNDCLTFKVRTSNQSGYVVKPSRGLVSTTSAQEVVVSLCAPRDENNFDPEKRESKDGFMIEVANISRDKYTDLVKLDERKRTREISSLWSLMPRSDRESTMLSVEFKMNDSDYGSGTLESSESGNSNARSWSSSSAHKNRNKTAQRQSLHSVVQGMKELSTSSSTDESHESAVGDRLNSIYPYSDSDESAFTIAPTAVPTEVGDDDNNDDSTYSSASKTPQDSAVIVVSADRMDTVDFSNPKLSFFI
ncbi:PapD-like [Phytophthora cactorum]|nr:PapD-like [Phytophthora cactorum]